MLAGFRSTFFGHYIAFVKGGDNKWHMCDDEAVTEVPWSEVQKRTPYILFYQRKGIAPASLHASHPVLYRHTT